MLTSKSSVFKCFCYSDVCYSDPHCIFKEKYSNILNILSDQTQRETWGSGSMGPSQLNPWGPGLEPGPRNPWGPGLNLNQQWQSNLDPLHSEFDPQRHQAAQRQHQRQQQQQQQPEVGGRLNFAQDSFINPMYRRMMSGGNPGPFSSNLGGPGSFGGGSSNSVSRDSFGDNSRGSGSFGGGSGSFGARSFADDDDNCNFGPDKNSGGPTFSGFLAPRQMTNFDNSMGNNCFPNNQRFSSLDDLQRAQQQQQQQQFGPNGRSRGNNFF